MASRRAATSSTTIRCTDGCGIPTLATPLKSLARAMASMADPSRLSNKHAEAATRIRAAMNAEPFMMAGTGAFGTRINAALPNHLGVLPAEQRDEILHPPVRNVVGLLVGEMRPAKSWLG